MATSGQPTLGLSDKTRVLYAALHLPTFTVKQLAAVTGVNENTVQTTLGRSKDLIEEVGSVDSGKPGGQPTIYRLRERSRAVLAREAAELAEKLRGPTRGDDADAARQADVALRAVASSIELSKSLFGSEGSAEEWRERAREQLNLSKGLVPLVSNESERAPLEARLKSLEASLTAPKRQTDWFESWKAFAEQCQPAAAFVGGVNASPWNSPAIAAAVNAAPAMIFKTRHARDLTTERVAAALDNAQHPVLEVEVSEALLREWQGRHRRDALLQALHATQRAVVIVTMDSQIPGSQSLAGTLLEALGDYLWIRNQRPPATVPDFMLIDEHIDSAWVQVDQSVRNLSYLPNVRNASSIQSVIEGMLRSDRLDAAHSSSITAMLAAASERFDVG
jgi:hypothetical protein